MPPSVQVKTLTIDERPLSARADETVLQVAKENDIFIPTLCNLDGVTPIGACRLCLIEVKGVRKLLPACVTKVWEGMEVFTQSEKLDKYRKMVLSLIFAERNHICAVCVSNGHCELQRMAQKLGLDHIQVPYRYPQHEVDASHDRFVIDHNRCILCTRCVRVCEEVEGAHTWDVMNRGEKCKVISDLNQPWGDSPTCTECGKCVHVCPTGALAEKGKSSSEMIKRSFISYLTMMRGKQS